MEEDPNHDTIIQLDDLIHEASSFLPSSSVFSRQKAYCNPRNANRDLMQLFQQLNEIEDANISTEDEYLQRKIRSAYNVLMKAKEHWTQEELDLQEMGIDYEDPFSREPPHPRTRENVENAEKKYSNRKPFQYGSNKKREREDEEDYDERAQKKQNTQSYRQTEQPTTRRRNRNRSNGSNCLIQ